MRYFKNLIISIGVLFAFAFASCSTQQPQLLFKERGSIPDTLRLAALSNGNGTSDYRIRSQDILQIRNLQNIKYVVDETPAAANNGGSGVSTQGMTYQVEDDGTVALPVIGRVHVAGMTRNEATKQIEDLYRKDVLKDPIIELKIINLKVTVLGEIRAQGNYPLIKDKTNLIEMIGEAGGLTDKANEKNIKIIRGDPKNPQITEVDLSRTATLADPRLILQNNDIIYIAQNKRAVKNEQLQNLNTTLQPALIILNTALIIYTLIHR
ncbi:polysaccharide biosynthesis/export family protein [Mucilaginibacter sp. BT774]|uniref:polysaccharide biosynthesis/export family protein n=1 Tax=Mucilaginibacter sp. BT774 TaxID=3062276 RepID=UPI00267592DC|nr:polysaccharide biosynthesis/export family protein [Mucilaginibacter sp. BT774]MDO3627509.1 polysaccharide biosynthesis/export family protein [Mucilaginibacter sp. BT774]